MSSGAAGKPFMITKIALITNPVSPPARPKVRRNAARATTARHATTDAAVLSCTAVVSAVAAQQARAAPAPQPTRSRRAPRGTPRDALSPPKHAVAPISGSPSATPSASGAHVAIPPASPAR